MDANELRRALIVATKHWRQLDAARDKAREDVFQAAADYLRTDVPAAEVVALTPFSDATIRAEARKRGVDPKRRGPHRKQESIPESGTSAAPPSAPVPPPGGGPLFMSASDRHAELIDRARHLPPGRYVELVSWLEQHHWGWLKANRKRDDSDWDVVQKAIKAGLLTTSQLV